MRRMPRIELPAGTHYALTTNIPDQYAGMTASMLQRSRAFVKYAGVDVTILTYDPRASYGDVRERLRSTGATVDGITVRNMWEDLRGWSNDELARATPSFTVPIPEDFEALGDRGAANGPIINALHDADGRLIQADYLRADGTVLVSERRHGPDMAARQLTLCDTSGEPLGSWDWASPLYFCWLDSMPRDPVAWIIVDSKTAATLVTEYQRPDVARMHVVRGTHLSRGHEGPMSQLSSTRSYVMERIDAWDSVTFLTKRQLDDVETRFGPKDNLSVIPNSREVPATLSNLRRRRGRGVMLASLEPRKQIAHVIRAMVKVKRRLPRRRIRVDVWGRGALESKLNDQIRSTGAPVTLRGHSTRAADEFSKASFSLLTSRSEAFGNVFIESMGRGCIPISYDTPYGPSDIVTHGVDGFIVPFGDVDALADQIRTVITMSPSKLAKIRKAGHRRAREYTDERAVRQWSDVMAMVTARRGF
jgi:poly(glycerol-phosphate) alpha-glucosyltransferase